MEVPLDYHILFIAMSFIVFIITIFLLFIDTTFEKTVGAFILCGFNILLNLIVAFIFSGVDIYGFDSNGNVVHNISSSMHPLAVVYMSMIFINTMLMLYCSYIFIKKPWTERMGDEFTQGKYQGPPY